MPDLQIPAHPKKPMTTYTFFVLPELMDQANDLIAAVQAMHLAARLEVCEVVVAPMIIKGTGIQ